MKKQVHHFIEQILGNTPDDWLNLTTHRLDIYHEELAKTEFLEQLEDVFNNNTINSEVLNQLPTAYDYIRLGHPLSSVLEWAIAKLHKLKSEQVISFSSKTVPVLAVLRKNLFEKKKSLICYTGELPEAFDTDAVKSIYGYNFDLRKVADASEVPEFDGSTIFFSQSGDIVNLELHKSIDFYIHVDEKTGSIILANGEQNESYVSEIQHVRRRESIAMTPANCLDALKSMVGQGVDTNSRHRAANKAAVLKTIQSITGTEADGLVGSSGLSIQYAIMMGLVDHARENHQGKAIKVIVPPNCYGGTNDQSRRLAAALEDVEVVDFPVDAGNDMVLSINTILDSIAAEDAVPYIIAEIPTNPRVEVPDLEKLRDALSKERKTPTGETAIDPVFILDQTFCPNVNFVGANDILASVRTISYVSGSKFPSSGKCTAGYCVANKRAENLMHKIAKHLLLCDNEATTLQYEILAEQMPSMLDRIAGAYRNTREFVNYIEEVLPDAKINFVSEELASQGFTPSVFSLDLPTKGSNEEEKEAYKRELNLKLINLMINEIPSESKYCVSYGQLKGCYWTVPATSTQGTTKEGDKDYIARVAVSANLDLEKHKEVFGDFVESL